MTLPLTSPTRIPANTGLYVSPVRAPRVPLEANQDNLEAVAEEICLLLQEIDLTPGQTYANGDLDALNDEVFQFHQIRQQIRRQNLVDVNADSAIVTVVKAFARNVLGRTLIHGFRFPEMQQERYQSLRNRMTVTPLTPEDLANQSEALNLWHEAAMAALVLFEQKVDPQGVYGRLDHGGTEDRFTLDRFNQIIHTFSLLQHQEEDAPMPLLAQDPIDNDFFLEAAPRDNRPNRRNEVRGREIGVRETTRIRLNFDRIADAADDLLFGAPQGVVPRINR